MCNISCTKLMYISYLFIIRIHVHIVKTSFGGSNRPAKLLLTIQCSVLLVRAMKPVTGETLH